jgi:hypothetical protein
MSTIIFLSGLGVPKILAKSSLVWNDSIWQNHRRIYFTSRIPTSDQMVRFNLKKLTSFINIFPDPIVIGQSLGAWWAANLACEPTCKMKKMVLCIPLCDTKSYPIFNVSALYHPKNRFANKSIMGKHKTLVASAVNDWIVPAEVHAKPLEIHFDALSYKMKGGHLLQRDHKAGLNFIKNWVELD